jgi:Lysozyme like domain
MPSHRYAPRSFRHAARLLLIPAAVAAASGIFAVTAASAPVQKITPAVVMMPAAQSVPAAVTQGAAHAYLLSLVRSHAAAELQAALRAAQARDAAADRALAAAQAAAQQAVPVPPPVPLKAAAPPASAPAASAPAPGGNLSYGGLEALWVSAGGNPAYEGVAACIATAESGGRQYATGSAGERGYWQINPVNGALSTYDPYGNARAAVIMSRDGTNWAGDWTTAASCGA